MSLSPKDKSQQPTPPRRRGRPRLPVPLNCVFTMRLNKDLYAYTMQRGGSAYVRGLIEASRAKKAEKDGKEDLFVATVD